MWAHLFTEKDRAINEASMQNNLDPNLRDCSFTALFYRRTRNSVETRKSSVWRDADVYY